MEEQKKPAGCTCKYPEVVARNMHGHGDGCHVGIAWEAEYLGKKTHAGHSAEPLSPSSRWTEEKPASDGFYWFVKIGGSERTIVHVHFGQLFLSGIQYPYDLEMTVGMFCGPINPPELPQE